MTILGRPEQRLGGVGGVGRLPSNRDEAQSTGRAGEGIGQQMAEVAQVADVDAIDLDRETMFSPSTPASPSWKVGCRDEEIMNSYSPGRVRVRPAEIERV